MLNRILVLVGLIALGSCVDSKDYNLSSVTVTPTMAIPLASGELSILDIVSDKDSAYIKTYSDGLLYFYYNKTLVSQDIRQLFTLPDRAVNTSIPLTAGTVPPNNQDVQSNSIIQVIDLNLSPSQLNEILFKAGSLNYVISSSATIPNLNYSVNFIIDDMVDNTTQVPLNITATGTGNKSIQNYKATLNSNKFNVKLVLIIKQHANSIIIPPGAKINIQMSFVSMGFSYLKGFLGDRTANIPIEAVDLTIFSSSLKKSSVSFVQPVVKMNVSNENGVPTEVTFLTLNAKKTGSNLPMLITPANPVNLNYPTVFGNSAATTVTVTNSTDLINFLPTQLSYSATARINKGLSSGNNFLSDNSALRITVSAEVPMYGRASNMIMGDTLAVNFGNISATDVSSASMRIKATNELPLDSYIQIYLTDKNYVIQDSLFSSNQTYLVKASTITAGGDLQTAGSTSVDVNLNTTKLNKVFSSSYLIIRSKLNTSKDANGLLLNVKFKATYKLKMNVGLNVKLNFTTK